MSIQLCVCISGSQCSALPALLSVMCTEVFFCMFCLACELLMLRLDVCMYMEGLRTLADIHIAVHIALQWRYRK